MSSNPSGATRVSGDSKDVALTSNPGRDGHLECHAGNVVRPRTAPVLFDFPGRLGLPGLRAFALSCCARDFFLGLTAVTTFPIPLLRDSGTYQDNSPHRCH